MAQLERLQMAVAMSKILPLWRVKAAAPDCILRNSTLVAPEVVPSAKQQKIGNSEDCKYLSSQVRVTDSRVMSSWSSKHGCAGARTLQQICSSPGPSVLGCATSKLNPRCLAWSLIYICPKTGTWVLAHLASCRMVNFPD